MPLHAGDTRHNRAPHGRILTDAISSCSSPVPQPLRTLEEISADIVAIEKEADGLLDGLLKGAK